MSLVNNNWFTNNSSFYFVSFKNNSSDTIFSYLIRLVIDGISNLLYNDNDIAIHNFFLE